MAKKITRKNAAKVVEALLKLKDKKLANEILAAWNDALDSFAEQDAFGTEGQNDPRGDQRE